jgi:nucleoside-diphosphate-sugar epimerase
MVPEGVNYKFVKGSIADKVLVDKLFEDYKFDVVVNLAAQAGVRYSIENPDVYIESNIIGFYNILEACHASQKFSVESLEFRV